MHHLLKQLSFSEYGALHYSKKQEALCVEQDSGFKCNVYDGKQYSEFITGQTEIECKSGWDDAVCIWSGTITEYIELEMSNQLQYN